MGDGSSTRGPTYCPVVVNESMLLQAIIDQLSAPLLEMQARMRELIQERDRLAGELAITARKLREALRAVEELQVVRAERDALAQRLARHETDN